MCSQCGNAKHVLAWVNGMIQRVPCYCVPKKNICPKCEGKGYVKLCDGSGYPCHICDETGIKEEQ